MISYTVSYLAVYIMYHTVSYHAVSYTVSYHAVSYTVSYHTVLYTVSYHAVSYNVSYHAVSYTVSYHTVSYTVSYHTLSYTVSYHTVSYTLCLIIICYLWYRCTLFIVNITFQAHSGICAVNFSIMTQNYIFYKLNHTTCHNKRTQNKNYNFLQNTGDVFMNISQNINFEWASDAETSTGSVAHFSEYSEQFT